MPLKKSPFTLRSDWKPKGDQPKAIRALVRAFREGKRRQTLLGVTGSGKTFVMANVIEQLGVPALVMAPNKTLAAQLYSEFKNFFPENAVEYFVSYYDYYQPEAYIPQRDIYIEKDASINEQLDRLRMAASSALLSRTDVVIVASVSCIYGLGDPEDYREMVLHLRQDQVCERDELLHQLVAMQYTRNDYQPLRGNFRVRGDVVEIWPSYLETVLRLELFGDFLERIGVCEPISGKCLKNLASVTLYPARHYVMPPEKVQKALDSIREELGARLGVLHKEQKLVEAGRLEARTLYDLEMLQEAGYCTGIENYSRHFSEREPGDRPYCLLDYFPDSYLAIVDESHVSIPQVRGMYLGDRSRKETLVEHGFRLPSALDNRPLMLEEWEAVTDHVLFVSATPGEYELKKAEGEVVDLLVRPTGLLDPEVEVHSAQTQVPHVIGIIKEKALSRERVLVTTLTKRLAEDLTEYLKRESIRVAYLHCDIDTFERTQILNDLRRGKYDALVGINLLREGLDLPEVSVVAILDADREGFLRSETSLIQMMGRAARHQHARVLLYADRSTPAMQRAIEETRRRREIQVAYNRKHKIRPRSVHKEILQSIEYVLEEEAVPANFVKETVTPEMISELEQGMREAAAALDFEKAAQLRDQILALQGKMVHKR